MSSPRINMIGLDLCMPLGVLDIEELDWGRGEAGRPLGRVLYSAEGCELVALSAVNPVLRSGVPHAAVVLDRADTRTRRLVGQRLLKLLPATGLHIEGLDLLTPLPGGQVHHDNPVVVVATWDCRAALELAADRLLDADPVLQRALLRTGDWAGRRCHDSEVIRQFRGGAGVHRQVMGPHRRTWRLSDFTVHERLSLRGVEFTVAFEDYELLECAENALQAYARRVGEPEHLSVVDVFDPQSMPNHTGFVGPVIRLVARWNSAAVRREMALLLREIADVPGTGSTTIDPRTDPVSSLLGLGGDDDTAAGSSMTPALLMPAQSPARESKARELPAAADFPAASELAHAEQAAGPCDVGFAGR